MTEEEYKQIIRVWGTADSYDLLYTLDTDGKWKVSIPADMDDGTYAVDVFAQNRALRISHWTGFLYMHQGKACLHLNKQKYMFVLYVPQIELKPRVNITVNYKECYLCEKC